MLLGWGRCVNPGSVSRASPGKFHAVVVRFGQQQMPVLAELIAFDQTALYLIFGVGPDALPLDAMTFTELTCWTESSSARALVSAAWRTAMGSAPCPAAGIAFDLIHALDPQPCLHRH